MPKKGNIPWNKGLTKQNDKRVAQYGINSSKTKKILYKNGSLEPWNKGLTKNNDERINKSSNHYPKNRKKPNKFTFNMGLFPNEFSLKKMQNMFHPFKNKNGYTRDHILSIFDGFNLNILPEYIKHPANCELLLHSENSRKNKNSSVTKEKLLEKIKKWETKYGKRFN